MTLPILSMSVYIISVMPDLLLYNFQPYSNPTTSGGYGPNQVSTLFGLGISCVLLVQMFKTNLYGSNALDRLILAVFCLLGLITFSGVRG